MTIDLSPRQVEILYSLIAAAEQRLQDEDPTQLTTRELEVLSLLSRGHPRKQIARGLEISLSTVDNHLLAIFQKLNASNACHAITIAYDLKILDPSQNP